MRRILIVDDSPTIRRMVAASLESLDDVCFEEASNGLEGIEMLARERVSLMILDLNMPDMHGLEVLQFVRSYGQYRSLCRICPNAGTFFEKPCRRESLDFPVSLCWCDSGKTHRRNYCQFDTSRPRRDFPQSDGWWGRLLAEENA